MEPDEDSLGERLVKARAGRTIDDVVSAYRARWEKQRGFSRGSLSRWERGEGRPGDVILGRLAIIYEVALADLDPAVHTAILDLVHAATETEYAPRDSNPEPADSQHLALTAA